MCSCLMLPIEILFDIYNELNGFFVSRGYYNRDQIEQYFIEEVNSNHFITAE